MICKWCGAALPDHAQVCGRCKREIPALSDCGGFYNLITDSTRYVVFRDPITWEGNDSQETSDSTQTSTDTIVPEDDKPPKRKRLYIWPFIVFPAIAAIMSTICLIAGLILGIYSPTFPASPDNQDVFVHISMAPTELQPSIQISADLADSYGTAITRIYSADDIGNMHVEICASEYGSLLTITFRQSNDDRESGTLEAQITIDDTLNSDCEGAIYLWEYQIDDQWVVLDESVFSISDDGTTVHYSISEWESWAGSNNNAEIRLSYTQTNEDGRSITVQISGIQFQSHFLEDIE